MDRDAEFNPAAGAPYETNWKGSTPGADDRDPPTLEANDVQALVDTCDSVADRLFVVATCAWGLSRGEVARLSRDQFAPTDDDGFDFEAEDPHIVFDEERKNGPGRVSIIYGLETLANRWVQLTDRDDWEGYLFPSSAAESGHRSPDTITKRFKGLAEDAGLEIRDETPTPQYGRRFWYQTYGDAVKRLSSQIEAVAAAHCRSSLVLSELVCPLSLVSLEKPAKESLQQLSHSPSGIGHCITKSKTGVRLQSSRLC